MKILISSSKGLRGVESNNIIYCEADNNYTNIYLTENRKFLATVCLKEIEELLSLNNFFRCHKSFLVNLDFFEELDYSHNTIILVNAIQVKFSRNLKLALREKLKFIAENTTHNQNSTFDQNYNTFH